MPKLTPKKTFLLKQINEDGKPVKTIVAHKGIPIEVTNEEAVKFAGYWEVSDEKEKKKVLDAAKANPNAKRMV